MCDRYYEIRKRLTNLAACDTAIRTVIEIGSQARQKNPADEYSDLDVIIVCDDYDEYLYSDEKLSQIGEIRISFTEDTFGGGKERRILFDGSLDVDFIFLSREQITELIDSGFLNIFLSRGYRILYDEMQIIEKITVPSSDAQERKTMPATEYNNIVNDFWFHTVWANKKICRGEYWVAVMCVNAYLKALLLKVMELYYGGGDNCTDVWHDGRFLEKWADEKITDRLKDCFAVYDKESIKKALRNTADLFSELAKACAKRENYFYPGLTEDYARAQLEK